MKLALIVLSVLLGALLPSESEISKAEEFEPLETSRREAIEKIREQESFFARDPLSQKRNQPEFWEEDAPFFLPNDR